VKFSGGVPQDQRWKSKKKNTIRAPGGDLQISYEQKNRKIKKRGERDLNGLKGGGGGEA